MRSFFSFSFPFPFLLRNDHISSLFSNTEQTWVLDFSGDQERGRESYATKDWYVTI